MSEANLRNIAINECAPAAARGVPATPAGARIVVSLLPGGSLRSPPVDFLFVTVFMKSWTYSCLRSCEEI